MPYDPNKHHRQSIRLKGYDYSQAGAYFVTMCAQHRELLFVTNNVIDMIQRWWDKLPEKFPGVETDAFVIMPNHSHGVIVIVGADLYVGPGLGEPTGSPQRIDNVGVVPRDDPVPGQTHRSDPTTDNVEVNPRVDPALVAPGLGEHTGSPQRRDDVGVVPRDDPVPGQTHGSAPTTDNVGVNPRVDPSPRGNPAPTLGEIIQWFKTMTTNEYIRGVKELNWPPFPGKLWQRNYFEHIIRSEIELNAIRQYIVDNPARWEQDRDNPVRIRPAAETVAAYLSEAGL